MATQVNKGTDIINIFANIVTTKSERYTIDLGDGQTMQMSFNSASNTVAVVINGALSEYPFVKG